MEITPPPSIPPVPGALPQDAVAKAIPQIATQAVTPITQRAIDPSGKTDRGNKPRSNGDKAKGGDKNSGRGGSVNLKV